MKALVFKEIRENLKLGALGLVVYAGLVLAGYCQYKASPTNLHQPLVGGDLLWNTMWFGGIFGAVLGWWQIFNERRPDLWAFLLHRPMTRTEIFAGKTLAGIVLYAAVVALPLVWFAVWALWPGHVAAPFELRMLRPLAVCILTGVPCYFAGMLVGLRPVRYYGSRKMPLGMAFLVCAAMLFRPAWWEGFLVLLAGAAALAVAAWGGFQTHGYYRGQRWWTKAALAIAVMLGCMIVALAAAGLLGNLVPTREQPRSWSNYEMTRDGTVYKVTQGPGHKQTIEDLQGKPLVDGKTGNEIAQEEFYGHMRGHCTWIALEERRGWGLWAHKDLGLATGWRATSDTLWYYWERYGRLVGYDIRTRRCIGSLGPNGFTQDLAGGGERFSRSIPVSDRGYLATATTLYRLDLERRTVKAVFTTASDDPIVASARVKIDPDITEREYTAVVTERFVHLLTADGQPVCKAPYDGKGKVYGQMRIYLLEPAGRFAVWLAPSSQGGAEGGGKLPTRVLWLAQGQDVVRSAVLPALAPSTAKPRPDEKLMGAVAPPAGLVLVPWLVPGAPEDGVPRELLLLSWGSAVLVCLPIGLWLGRRYRFSVGAQAGWAVFHVLFGLPGLLAFLGVQEWPAREACPSCKRLRLVDRAQCEHCGAEWAPPEKTGTEVFEPLGVSA